MRVDGASSQHGHATVPQAWMQQENWEFETHSIPVRCWRTTSVETWQTWPMNSASTWLQDAYPTTWESSPK